MEYYGKFWSDNYPDGYVIGNVEIIVKQGIDPNYPDKQEIQIIFSYTGEYRNGVTLELCNDVENLVEDLWITIDVNTRMKIVINEFNFYEIKAEYSTNNPFDFGTVHVRQMSEPER